MTAVGGFAGGERAWQAGLGGFRDLVRQELVARQLDAHLPPGQARVLDVGCGQGTQALRLALAGHQVTGVDMSAELLAVFARDLAGHRPEVRHRVTLIRHDATRLDERFPRGGFDVVLCQGVLMYLPGPASVLRGLAHVAAPGAMISLLVRNGDALAMRPGLQHDWETARQAFAGRGYVNRLGLAARADRFEELRAALSAYGMTAVERYGVRVFTDTAPDDHAIPDADTLAALLACEELAGRTDPYRQVAALTHVIARAG